ncbi:MAG: hypothetical protein FWF30_04745, partial [Coriobacteriia bacterium]|nr:hypothetical protein [Coriobacteriia bacterium]
GGWAAQVQAQAQAQGLGASPALFSNIAYADSLPTDQVGGVSLADQPVSDAPDIQASYGTVAAADGTMLWSRDTTTETPMASTTKIMTAIVALESADPNMDCTVTPGAASTGGSTAGLRAGEVVKLKDLLVALLLPSGNDAAVAIAENIAGTQFAFVDMMNKKAADLGMNNTHFADTNGLTEVNHYTTVQDYLILARYAMQNDTFKSIVGMQEDTVTIGQRQVTYHNTNLLFNDMDGVLGIKTGTNIISQSCLVACVQHNGLTFYSIIFGSPTDASRYQDTETLLNWAFKHYWKAKLIDSTQTVANMAMTDWIDKSVPVSVPQPVVTNIFDCNGPITQDVEVADWPGAVHKGDKVGRIVWSQNGEVIASSDLVAAADQAAPNIWERIAIGWQRFWGGFSGKPKHLTTEVTVPQTLKTADDQTTQ